MTCLSLPQHALVLVSECSYLLLRGDGEFVAGYETAYLVHPQIEKLLTLDYLREMLFCRWGKMVGEKVRSLVSPAYVTTATDIRLFSNNIITK